MIECLFPSFEGPDAPDWVRRLIAEGLGGVVLFASNVRDREQLAALTSALRVENPELVIALDEEGGNVTRLHAGSGSPYPGNAALGAVDDVELTERIAASIAAELADVGVNLDLAPVADVNVDPANPVIGVRSFGADAALVARHVAAYVSGLQANGVAACAKHFPGHGATDRDSHLELPTVSGDVADGLPPFRAAIAAGVQSIMTAHIRVPAFGDAPATMNPRALALLRHELGYDGLVIGDACEMRGFADAAGLEEGAVQALSAGVDALIVGRDLGEDAVARIRTALGRVPEERRAEAAARVRRVAAWAAAPREGEADRALGLDAARRALRVEGDVALDGAVEIVELHPEANIAAGKAAHSLTDLIPSTSGGRLVIVVRDAHRHGWMRERIEAHPEAVVVETGLPYWRPRARGYVATYGGSRASLEAVAGLLRAEVPA